MIDPRFNSLIELLGRLLAQQVLAELDEARKVAAMKNAASPDSPAHDHQTTVSSGP